MQKTSYEILARTKVLSNSHFPTKKAFSKVYCIQFQAVVAASMLVSLDRLKTEAQSEYSRRRSGMVGGGSSPSVY